MYYRPGPGISSFFPNVLRLLPPIFDPFYVLYLNSSPLNVIMGQSTWVVKYTKEAKFHCSFFDFIPSLTGSWGRVVYIEKTEFACPR